MNPPESPVASISSVLSSESTKNLISSLSHAKLDVTDLSQASLDAKSTDIPPPALNTTVTPVLPPVTSPSLVLPKAGSKKPIKFTVRKVSREENVTIPSRTHTTSHQYAYGNIPENRKKLTERKSESTVLQQNQEKYDSYVNRLDKIDKEINFLLDLLPPYNVEIDYATRNKIARAVEKLRMKRDEVEKKKHTLGMSISRMWREFDENETWVRSVSNH